MATENSVRSENKEVPIIREIMVATTMSSLFVALFALVVPSFRTRAALQAEILALRHQLAVFQKNAPCRLDLQRCDRLLWVVLSRFWSSWRRCLQMVQPDTVLRWHRRAFAWHWTRKSRRLPGRPEVASNIRDLIRRTAANADMDSDGAAASRASARLRTGADELVASRVPSSRQEYGPTRRDWGIAAGSDSGAGVGV